MTLRCLAMAGAGVLLASDLALAQTPARPAAFTAAQATRGKDVYAAECASCHGVRLTDGNAVPLAGRAFLQKWSHPLVTLDDLSTSSRRRCRRIAATCCRRPTTPPSPRT